MPPQLDFIVGQENERIAAFERATARLTADRARRFRDLGFDVTFQDDGSFTRSRTNDPFSQTGELFQSEADATRNAETQGFFQSGGGVGSGGLFNRPEADVRRQADLGRLQIEKQFAETQAAFLQGRQLEKDALDADLALFDIEKKLTQEFDPFETQDEIDDPAVPAGEVSFNFRGKTKTFTSKKDLVQFLKARGKDPKKWVANHPEAARQLGFKVPGDNTQPRGNQLRSREAVHPALRSRSGKRLTPAQIARFKRKNPNSKRFR